MATIYFAWRAPGKAWYPIGKLSIAEEGHYVFEYVAGARKAAEAAGFKPLDMFPEFTKKYRSTELFAVFANRLPPRERQDYETFVTWMNVPRSSGKEGELALLARSEGLRVTDNFQVFACPEPEDGKYVIKVFIHGIRFTSQQDQDRALTLKEGESLSLAPEPANPSDPWAVQARTEDGVHKVGYLPRYLNQDIHAIGVRKFNIKVIRVHKPPVPIQYRVLCELSAPWPPSGFAPCSGAEFEPFGGPGSDAGVPTVGSGSRAGH